MGDLENNSSTIDVSKRDNTSEHYINEPKYTEDDLNKFKDAWLLKYENIRNPEAFKGQTAIQPYLQVAPKTKNFFGSIVGNLGPVIASNLANNRQENPQQQEQLIPPPPLNAGPQINRVPRQEQVLQNHQNDGNILHMRPVQNILPIEEPIQVDEITSSNDLVDIEPPVVNLENISNANTNNVVKLSNDDLNILDNNDKLIFGNEIKKDDYYSSFYKDAMDAKDDAHLYNYNTIKSGVLNKFFDNTKKEITQIADDYKRVTDLEAINYNKEASQELDRVNSKYHYTFGSSFEATNYLKNVMTSFATRSQNFFRPIESEPTIDKKLEFELLLQFDNENVKKDKTRKLIESEGIETPGNILDEMNTDGTPEPNNRNENIQVIPTTDITAALSTDIVNTNNGFKKEVPEFMHQDENYENAIIQNNVQYTSTAMDGVMDELVNMQDTDIFKTHKLYKASDIMIENLIKLDEVLFSGQSVSPDYMLQIKDTYNELVKHIDDGIKLYPGNVVLKSTRIILSHFADFGLNVDQANVGDYNGDTQPMQKLVGVLVNILEDEKMPDTPTTDTTALVDTSANEKLQQLAVELEDQYDDYIDNDISAEDMAETLIKSYEYARNLKLGLKPVHLPFWKIAMNQFTTFIMNVYRQLDVNKGVGGFDPKMIKMRRPLYGTGLKKIKKLNALHLMDKLMSKIPNTSYPYDNLAKKPAKGCGYCGGNKSLHSHDKDLQDFTCETCLTGKGMSAKRFSKITTKFYPIDKSNHSYHKNQNKQHAINRHLLEMSSIHPKTTWEMFDDSSNIKKNWVKPYSKSYMMDRKSRGTDIDKTTYLMGMLEHNKENMTPELKANLLTLLHNHNVNTKSTPEENIVYKGGGLNIDLNAFDDFTALKNYLTESPQICNYILV